MSSRSCLIGDQHCRISIPDNALRLQVRSDLDAFLCTAEKMGTLKPVEDPDERRIPDSHMTIPDQYERIGLSRPDIRTGDQTVGIELPHPLGNVFPRDFRQTVDRCCQ